MVLTVEARVRIVLAEAQQKIHSSIGRARGEARYRLAKCFRVSAAIEALTGVRSALGEPGPITVSSQ